MCRQDACSLAAAHEPPPEAFDSLDGLMDMIREANQSAETERYVFDQGMIFCSDDEFDFPDSECAVGH